jgi:predicted aminopeptidase
MPAEQMRNQKSRLFLRLREEYAELRRQWHGYDAYDSWFRRRLNNATLAPIGTYHGLVPYFRALLKDSDARFDVFLQQAEEIGELPEDVRRDRLQQLLPARIPTPLK